MEMKYEIIKKNIMPDGTAIQIEDWSKIYSCFIEDSTLAAYPISKWNCKGSFSPKIGKTFRAEFEFNNAKECREAFDSLVSGETTLLDYIDKYNARGAWNKEERDNYYKCLGWKEGK